MKLIIEQKDNSVNCKLKLIFWFTVILNMQVILLQTMKLE